MRTLLLATAVFFTLIVSAQVSGNQVIEGSNHTITPKSKDQVYLNDSSMVIHARVMSNVIADKYIATFGVSQSATTLKEANTIIDERIDKFKAALGKMGIPKTDVYVDLTTQTEIRDYRVDGDYAEQYVSGYEQKKNVIIRFDDLGKLDQMMIIASENDIYDLAEVDYLIDDIDAIYNQLFEEAIKVVNTRKNRYSQATNSTLGEESMIYGESFYSQAPPQLYKKYSANISTVYRNYRSYGTTKDLGPRTTYYFEKMDYSGFDKVINPHEIVPAIQYVLVLQVKFEVE